jgi:hypothetical protein
VYLTRIRYRVVLVVPVGKNLVLRIKIHVRLRCNTPKTILLARAIGELAESISLADLLFVRVSAEVSTDYLFVAGRVDGTAGSGPTVSPPS